MQLQVPQITAPEPGGRFEDDLGRKMLAQRRVMLTGPIDGAVAERICTQLLVVDAGFAIYDTMQALHCDVATVCMGFAASMAQFLLCAGTPGKRAAYPNSRILLHQPHGAVQGFAVDIAIQAEQFTRMRELMAELIAKHSGQPVQRVFEDGERDRWFTPEEALEYGLIDEILQSAR